MLNFVIFHESIELFLLKNTLAYRTKSSVNGLRVLETSNFHIILITCCTLHSQKISSK